MSSKGKFIRITTGKLEGLYQLKRLYRPVDLDHIPGCPNCHAALAPALDICQYGMFEDRYTTYFVCKACMIAVKISYEIPTYTMLSKRQQKRSGLVRKEKKAAKL